MNEVLDWQRKSEMQMLIYASEGDPVPLSYTVIPLTTNLGLNESQLVRGVSDVSPTHTPRQAQHVTNMPLASRHQGQHGCCRCEQLC